MVYIILLAIIHASTIVVPALFWSPWHLIWAVPVFCGCSGLWYVLSDMRVQ